MITKDQVFPLLLEACPSFESSFAASVADYGSELPYAHTGAFAHHLLSLHQAGDQREFAAVGALLERLHAEGDDYVRGLATIGFLEAIQNVWSNRGAKPDELLPFLGPLSTAAWHALNKFWTGEIPLVPGIRNARP